MTKWEKLKRLLKNSLQATARTFSNPRAKFGTGIAKGKKLYGQVTTYLPVLKTKVGKVPMWGWITILTVFMLSSFILMGYWMVRWAVTNAPKLIKFDTLENWDLQAAVGLLIVFVLIAYMTRKKKPKAPTTGTQAGKTAPAAVAQAAATTASPTPTTKKEDEEGLSGWEISSIILLFIGLHVLWFLAVGSWGISNIGFNKVSWAVHAVLLIALFNLPKGKAPKNQTMARFAIVVVLFVFLPYQAYNNANWGGGQTQAATTVTTAVGVNLERTPCLEAEKGGDSEKIREALKDYPDLLAVACRESGLNHTDPKNRANVLVGKDDPRDTGFLQINTHFHPAEVMKGAVGCGDPKDFDCQVKYVKYLHDTSGLESWFPYGPNESGRQYKSLTVLLVADKEYSSRIHIPRITEKTGFNLSGPVIVETEDEKGVKREQILDPKNKTFTLVGVNIKWLRFKSPDETPVTVKVTYKFQQVP